MGEKGDSNQLPNSGSGAICWIVKEMNPMKTIISALGAAVLASCGLFGQAAAPPPAFEVASVKPAAPEERAGISGGPGTSDPGLFRCSSVTLGGHPGARVVPPPPPGFIPVPGADAPEHANCHGEDQPDYGICSPVTETLTVDDTSDPLNYQLSWVFTYPFDGSAMGASCSGSFEGPDQVPCGGAFDGAYSVNLDTLTYPYSGYVEVSK